VPSVDVVTHIAAPISAGFDGPRVNQLTISAKLPVDNYQL